MAFQLTRRSALAAGALLPFAGRFGIGEAHAAAEMKGLSRPIHYRFKLGDFEVTALSAGTGPMEEPQKTYGLDVPPEEFASVSAAAFIPADRSQNFYTPSLVNTGKELILFDTGPNAAGTIEALAAAGYTPEEVDIVVITHMHGDHINGIVGESGPTYPNARYVTGAIENDHWAAAGNEAYEKAIRPLAEKFTYLDDGGSVVPGVTAMAAFGHTPGHFVYHLESGGRRLVLTADLANHAVWSVGRPDWNVRFDMDKPTANETRKRVLGMLAADRVPFLAYHLAFPAVGYVEAVADGFRHVPVSYQLLLEG